MNITKIKEANCKLWNIKYSQYQDQIIARENLLIINDYLNNEVKNYCILFGTLLGFYRDKDFIAYDTDIDIAIINIRQDMINSLKDFMTSKEFCLFRDTETIISFIRKGVYIDFYKFTMINNSYICENFIFDKDLIGELKVAKYGSLNLKIPYQSRELLIKLYGENWMIPVYNFHACSEGLEENKILVNDYKFILLRNIQFNLIRKSKIFGAIFESRLVKLIKLVIKKQIIFLTKK